MATQPETPERRSSASIMAWTAMPTSRSTTSFRLFNNLQKMRWADDQEDGDLVHDQQSDDVRRVLDDPIQFRRLQDSLRRERCTTDTYLKINLQHLIRERTTEMRRLKLKDEKREQEEFLEAQKRCVEIEVNAMKEKERGPSPKSVVAPVGEGLDKKGFPPVLEEDPTEEESDSDPESL